MPATNAWDETKPAGSDLASTIDNQTRQLKLDIRERLALQHYWNASLSTDGIHKEISITPATTNTELLKTNSNQSLTGSSAVSAINLGITWNTTGAPTAIKAVVTDTASDAASLLLDLQTLAGGSRFKVDKNGLAYTVGVQLARIAIVETISAKWSFTAGISIPSGVPGVTTNTLYSNAGALFFNGSALATGSVVSGTSGTIAKFTSASTIGDSVITEASSIITIAVADAGVGTKTLHLVLSRTGAATSVTERMNGLTFQDANNATMTAGVAGVRENSAGNFLGGLVFFVHNTSGSAATDFSGLTEAGRFTSQLDLTLQSTTDMTSTTAAGVVIKGGVAIAKKLFVGTQLRFGAVGGATIENADGTTNRLLLHDGTSGNTALRLLSGSTTFLSLDVVLNNSSVTEKTLAFQTNGGLTTFCQSTLGMVSINTTTGSDSFQSEGLRVHQTDSAHGSIITLARNNWANGMTTLRNTTTLLDVGNFGNGVALNAWGTGASTTGLFIESFAGATAGDTTKSTAAVGITSIDSLVRSGTSVTTPGANENLLTVRANTTTRFILDADGDSHQDVGTAWTNFDTFDDAGLLTALSAGVSREGDPVRQQFGALLQRYRDTLTANRVVTFNDDGHHFVNWSRLNMLSIGAIRQLAARIAVLEEKLLGA